MNYNPGVVVLPVIPAFKRLRQENYLNLGI
jgi:hypothetical protein